MIINIIILIFNKIHNKINDFIMYKNHIDYNKKLIKAKNDRNL